MPLRPNPAEAVDDGGGEPDTAHNFRVVQKQTETWFLIEVFNATTV